MFVFFVNLKDRQGIYVYSEMWDLKYIYIFYGLFAFILEQHKGKGETLGEEKGEQ